MNRRTRAFTLVELLVVVTIIGVLAGLLLPALRGAQDRAKAAVCMSNLRQLTTATFLYTNDNDEYFPPSSWDIYTANCHRWHGVRNNQQEPFDFRHSPLYPYLKGDKIKACPIFAEYLKGFEAGCGGYGYNDSYVGSGRGDAQDRSSCPARRGMIADATNTILFADAAILQGSRVIEYSFVTEPLFEAWGGVQSTPSLHFRHHGRANVAWCDGHVSSEPLGWSPLAGNAAGGDPIGYVGPWHDNRLYDRK